MHYKPIHFNFPEKEKEEKVFMTVRRHYFVILKQLIIFIFLILFLPFVLFAISYFFEINLNEYNFYPIVVLFISIYYLFMCFFALVKWIEYYYDVWIITDKRLIDIEQKSLFNHVTSELRLDKIQDVTFEEKGLAASVFHYGNIYVQTAGAVQRFTFEHVPKSRQLKRLIIDLQGKVDRDRARR